MKICLVSQTFYPQTEGGAEMMARETAAHLSQVHDVVVLSLGRESDPDFPPGEQESPSGYRVFRVPFRNSYLPAAQRPRVSRAEKLVWHARAAIGAVSLADLLDFLTREAPDLIYAHNCARLQPALFRAAERLCIPVCLHLHDYALICAKTSMYRKNENCADQCGHCKLLSRRMRSGEACVSSVIAVSSFVQHRYQRHGAFPNASHHVLHNLNARRGPRESRPSPGPRPANRLFTFGYIGAIAAEKGVETLLDAFDALVRHTPARLRIAGSGEPDLVTRLAARSSGISGGSVDWLGFTDPDAFFPEIDALIVPSLWHEPQGRVVVEAAAHGVPVLASDRGGLPEVVQRESIGWCYDSSAPDGLVETMRAAASMGPQAWWQDIARLFPGIGHFPKTDSDAAYYRRLTALLTEAAERTRDPAAR